MTKKHGLAEPKSAFRRDAAPARVESEQRESKKRQAVNVYVNRDILKAARAMKINVSQVLERELDRLTGEERAKRFYEENKAFFDWHNEMVEKHGTLSEAIAELEDDDQAV
ncbi:MAG: type II toxin-antitoxin system CcdA family antitoxin [Alphaproteobacteria bacterium]|nr:type II toxin-antitoxin system CcdA family antitoxin [Alphaproteobacteria bacterium]MBL6940221.1 type II toxin-antitoxin system CcdA family antitoxin [Alphaproteobacteria bacterium]MBL7096871.1 type II toxin-antitoxin system CcdA family antitoxin [Alphaproteobacteria bacterium]